MADLPKDWVTGDELKLITRENTPYVYIYFLDGVPRYVGKGKGRRWKHHRCTKTHLGNALRKNYKENGCFQLPMIFRCDNDEQAICEEISLIAGFGRLDKLEGPLWNLTDGGEGITGIIFSEKRLLKAKAAAKDPDVNFKRSSSLKSFWSCPDRRAEQSASLIKNDRLKMSEKLQTGMPLSRAAAELNIPYSTLVAYRNKILGKKMSTFRPPKTEVGIKTWLYADKIAVLFQKKDKPLKIAHTLDLDPIALGYLLVKIRRGWVPNNDIEWLQWKNHMSKKILNKVIDMIYNVKPEDADKQT